MYIYVEEVNLKVSAGVHTGPGQMKFLDPFQQWIVILGVVFVQAIPYFIRIDDLKWFPHVHNH